MTQAKPLTTKVTKYHEGKPKDTKTRAISRNSCPKAFKLRALTALHRTQSGASVVYFVFKLLNKIIVKANLKKRICGVILLQSLR